MQTRVGLSCVGAAPEGLDTLLTTPHGVIGLNVNWPRRLNDAGYHLPPAAQPPEDTALSLFDAKAGRWQRLGEKQTSPQNLYERTSLAYDSNRDRVLLHGGGENRDELWSFELKEKRWKNLNPDSDRPQGAKPPASGREAVFLAKQDLLLSTRLHPKSLGHGRCGPIVRRRMYGKNWRSQAKTFLAGWAGTTRSFMMRGGT